MAMPLKASVAPRIARFTIRAVPVGFVLGTRNLTNVLALPQRHGNKPVPTSRRERREIVLVPRSFSCLSSSLRRYHGGGDKCARSIGRTDYCFWWVGRWRCSPPSPERGRPSAAGFGDRLLE